MQQILSDLDRNDIQGLVARGYPNLKSASYILLQIDTPTAACVWLGGLVDQVTPAPAHPADYALNVALTASGLRKLGLPDASLALFSNEFTAGMTTPHRRRTLGDIGDSAPEQWAWGGPNTPPPDALLLVFALDNTTLEQRYATLVGGFQSGGVSVIARLDSVVDLDGKEHFGFADGISQPTINGLSSRTDIPSNTVEPVSSSWAIRTNTGGTPTGPCSSRPPTRAECCRATAAAAANQTWGVMARMSSSANWLRMCAPSGTSSTRRLDSPMARATPPIASTWRPKWSAAGQAGHR